MYEKTMVPNIIMENMMGSNVQRRACFSCPGWRPWGLEWDLCVWWHSHSPLSRWTGRSSALSRGPLLLGCLQGSCHRLCSGRSACV